VVDEEEIDVSPMERVKPPSIAGQTTPIRVRRARRMTCPSSSRRNPPRAAARSWKWRCSTTAAAAGAGVDGFAFRLRGENGEELEPASGRRLPAMVEVDYSGFKDRYGAGHGDRLHVVARPECAFATLWRLEFDPRWQVEKLTAASNGDNDGEHWRVTTPDETQYYLGLGHSPDKGSATKSVWTVPVVGNGSGEPCNAAPSNTCEPGVALEPRPGRGSARQRPDLGVPEGGPTGHPGRLTQPVTRSRGSPFLRNGDVYDGTSGDYLGNLTQG
jgi:hypothetical protein